ncbi:MAG: hypothetical protein PPHEINF_3864 [uncultured Paraburkholderia sp.]|nr:MAG: hypothetical protein PPHEINF_3864 [uncultured Paraburkholderia sp.]CAH2796674.1 MAG: hypothetical protein PPHEESC_3929 [uncultured Paraburkholderia sp.]CAH2931314.1 MAG: hypothetical protein PPHEMADMSA_3854 [uncultured Paraburkholderia sp.]CAH2932809.1 MAG: hypothetical protein PPHERAN_3915 [uncultured Paraburkholderia sp.]
MAAEQSLATELIDARTDSPHAHASSRRARVLPGAVALMSVLVFLAAVPFAKIPLA